MDDVREDVDGRPQVSGPESGEPTGDDGGGDAVRVDWDDVERPSFDIVAAVADATDRNLVGLPPLHDTLDGDAVEALLRGDADLRLTFTYAGTSVVVDRGESIEVRPVTA